MLMDVLIFYFYLMKSIFTFSKDTQQVFINYAYYVLHMLNAPRTPGPSLFHINLTPTPSLNIRSSFVPFLPLFQSSLKPEKYSCIYLRL